MKSKLLSSAISMIMMIIVISFYSNVQAQTQRNPVLEYCTGTWCVYCPQGHAIIQNNILPNIPNAIIIGYHGPANGSDPFSFFPGNSIINTLLSQGGTTYYPTGSIDRISGVQSRDTWYSLMNSRNSVPATVAIELDKSFNKTTREFNASIDFTALTNLNGQYNFNVILLESGMVWAQTGGTSNYVHHHVVRSMMNGALGEEVINGTWNQNDVITKTINYTVPIPGGPGPDIIWDSCHVVVMVYKVGTPLASNAEIQQAIQTTLTSPDYVATLTSISSDLITNNNEPSQFTAVLYNQGLLDDTYDISVNSQGPVGWTGEFTTINGTFPFGQMDSVFVATGDSTIITVTVNPNGFNGSGETSLEFISKNDPGMVGNVVFRNVTNSGVHLLVVDATGEGYSSLVSDVLDSFYTGRYGIVSRSALQSPGLDLSYFTMISWSSGNLLPVFYPEEVNNLQSYLDQGGNLLIAGQNIGEDIFEPSGQSQFAQSFYNNYLHANYISSWGGSYTFTSVPNDPITNGIPPFSLNSVYDKSPDQISPLDASADSMFYFLTGPAVNSIRIDGSNYKAVYFGLGFEQINDINNVGIVDTLVARSVRWLTEGIILNSPSTESTVISYKLDQNYPNPFNPSTTISYSIKRESDVSLKVYDIMGREVSSIVNERQIAGSYDVEFDASLLASGIYFYKLAAGDFVSVKKMILLK